VIEHFAVITLDESLTACEQAGSLGFACGSSLCLSLL